MSLTLKPAGQSFESFPRSALDGSICDRFEVIAARFAGRTAVEDLDRRLTYGELSALADRIAAATAAACEGRSGPVAVLAGHDALFPVAMLGVLAAGRCVVPLDADHPPERNHLIARSAGAAAVISAGALAQTARRLFGAELPVLDVEALGDGPAAKPWPRPGPDDLAFILYTSGSTGAPKGVCHSHRNGVHDAYLATGIAHFSADDRMSMFYSAVVGGIRNILSALLNGASLHMLPPLELGVTGLVREIRARRITTFLSVPTLFRRVAGALPAGERFDDIRLVRLAGDRSEWSDVELFRRAFAPDAQLNVAIASTECPSSYAQWFVDDSAREPGARLPVGRPTPGSEVRIVDEAGEPLADGQIGEAVVTSPYLALGYWQAPELTEAVFSTGPGNTGERTFKTGDLCLRRPDGLLEFVGRKDQMVKLRGHRIEPAEVEDAMRRCSGLSDAAVVVRRDAKGNARSLVAYAELRPGTRGLLSRHLMAMASQRLPRFMTPSIIFVVEALPRLPNFKIDRSALARIDQLHSQDRAERRGGTVLDAVATVFERVVGTSGATADDNLLSMGGDSLQAIDVTLALEDRFGVAISPEGFEDSQTIRDLAAWISARAPRRALVGLSQP